MLAKIWFIHLFYPNLLFLISSLSKKIETLGWRDSSEVKNTYCPWIGSRFNFHTFMMPNNCNSSSNTSNVLFFFFFAPMGNWHASHVHIFMQVEMCTIAIKLKGGSVLLTKTVYSEVMVITISSWKSVRTALLMWV